MPHQAFRKSLYLALILILGLGLAVLLQWALDTGPLPTVHAAQVGPITTTDDELTTDGDCSLREAIQAANTDAAVDACPAGSGGDTILLPAGTFTLTLAGAIEHNNATGDLDITDALTIVGAGPELTVIDANRLDRVLDVRPAAGTVVISGVTVMNGESVGFSSGGGINVWYANLVLTNVIVYGNRAGGSGGGIHVEHGDTTLYETRVVSNYAGSAGGGIHVYMSTLTMNGGEITSNTSEAAGGGICKAYEGPDPTLVLSNVQVIGNVTPVQGGGFCCGNATIYASQFMSNTAIDGAGAFAGATPGETMVLSKTVFMSNTAQNNGGGVWLYGGTVTLDEVQIIDNTAGLGSGGLYYGGSDATVEISDSTFRANGVGLYLQARDDRDGGNIAIHNSVISDNTAAGVVYSGTSPITITLGGAPGGANTFRRNGPDGKVNVLAGAPDTSPPIRAFYNDWGVAGLADVESTFYHHFDDASLARIDYYTLTLDTVPTSQLANGQAPVTVTAALTGLLDLLPGAVISFTADLGTLSAPTSTTDASGYAHVTLTSTVTGTTTITATAGIDPFASRPATATVVFGQLSVTTTDDELTTDGDCSLREAIQAANTDSAVDACPAGSGGDTILLPAGTYTLTLAGANEDDNATGDLDITDALTIVGAGPELTVIDANHIDRVLDVRPAAGTVVISGVTVMNGESVGFSSGGGINGWYANLVLTNVVVYGNRAPASGGGVYVAHGDITLHETRVISNHADLYGGGIGTDDGNVAMWGGQIISNTSDSYSGLGGPFGGTCTLNGVQVMSNTAESVGGGIACIELTIHGGQIIGNRAMAGGGVFGENMDLAQVLIAGNTATGTEGGAIWAFGGSATLNQVRILHNSAARGSGGLYGYEQALEVLSSTIEGNGIGVYINDPGTAPSASLIVYNTVISGNATAGLVYTGTSPVTITLGGTPGTANTFRDNGPDGTMNVLVGAPGTSPPIYAFYNDWGVAGLADVEDTLHHHFDDPSLARIDYYTLTLDAAPTRQLANGQAPVTGTAALTGLLDLLPGAVISFTTDLGTLSAPTSTTDASGHAWVTLTSTVTGTATITATARVDPFAARSVTATASFRDWPWYVYLPAVTRNQVAGE